MTEIRLRCVVLGCRRTRGLRKGERSFSPGAEWMCSKHWLALPKTMRRVHCRAWRRARRYNSERDWRVEERIWRRLKRAAIERAGGIW